MKKFNKLGYTAIGMIIALIIGTVTPTFAASKDIVKQLTAYFTAGGKPISVYVDGTKVEKDSSGKAVTPFTVNGTTYLPVKAIADALGKSVTWDGTTASVNITDKVASTTATPTSDVKEDYKPKLTTTIDNKGERHDKLEYTLTLDNDAVGEWKVIDYCETISDFDPNKPSGNDLYVQGSSIYPDGMFTLYYNDGDPDPYGLWTKGYMIDLNNETVSTYEFKKIKGKTYMFVQWKNGDYRRDGYISYYVFEKTSNTPAPKSKANNATLNVTKDKNGIIHETLDYKFTLDNDAVGEWKTVSFCNTIADFNPDQPYDGNMWYIGNSIYEDGTFTKHRIAAGKNVDDTGLKWSRGYLVDLMKGSSIDVVPAYEFKMIDGIRYMFVEWKSAYTTKTGIIEGYYVFEQTSHTPAPKTTK